MLDHIFVSNILGLVTPKKLSTKIRILINDTLAAIYLAECCCRDHTSWTSVDPKFKLTTVTELKMVALVYFIVSEINVLIKFR